MLHTLACKNKSFNAGLFKGVDTSLVTLVNSGIIVIVRDYSTLLFVFNVRTMWLIFHVEITIENIGRRKC